jgi:hypothetical protein
LLKISFVLAPIAAEILIAFRKKIADKSGRMIHKKIKQSAPKIE